MTLFALVLSLWLLSPTPSPLAAPVAEAATFEMRIERDGATWRVACYEGCSFISASVGCSGECEVIVSSRGVQTRRDDALAETDFAFVLTPIENGWRAASLHGTSWDAVSATCGSRPCRPSRTPAGAATRSTASSCTGWKRKGCGRRPKPTGTPCSAASTSI